MHQTLYFSKFNQAGHNNNARALLLYIHWPPFTSSYSVFPLSVSIVKVYLASQLSFGHISAPPSYPEIQKEMSLQLGKEEDASRSSFRSGETWHDKRWGENMAQWSLSLPPPEFFQPRALIIAYASSKWIISCDGQFKYADQQKLCTSPLTCLNIGHRIMKNLRVWNVQDSLNYLQASLTSCIVVSAAAVLWAGQADTGGDKQTKTSRRDICQVQVWVLRLWWNAR